MTQEQDLLVHWRSLPAEQQQTVLDFIQFLHTKQPSAPVAAAAVQPSLGDSGTDTRSESVTERFANRLRNLRSQIVASGEPLLSQAALEQELVSRRGGVEGETSLEQLAENLEDYCLSNTMDEAQATPLLSREEAMRFLAKEDSD